MVCWEEEGDKYVQITPKSWVVKEVKMVYWPRKTVPFEKMFNYVPNIESWNKFICSKIFGPYTDLESAKSMEHYAINSLDTDEDTDVVIEKAFKQSGKRIPKKRSFSSSENDEDEDAGEKANSSSKRLKVQKESQREIRPPPQKSLRELLQLKKSKSKNSPGPLPQPMEVIDDIDLSATEKLISDFSGKTGKLNFHYIYSLFFNIFFLMFHFVLIF